LTEANETRPIPFRMRTTALGEKERGGKRERKET
jgi:hypothetical protein